MSLPAQAAPGEACIMNARFLHPSARNAKAEAQAAPVPAAPAPAAELADCCPAKAAVRVTVPDDQGRPHPADLLLCAHHYRASRPALASATVHALPGTPADIAAWIELVPAG
jgi:hypothetical protein